MDGRKQELFEEFLGQLSKLKRCMEQRSHIPSGEKVATMLQLQALSYIMNNPQTTVSNLANHLLLSSSAVAQLSDRLVESAWVERTHDESDRRIVHLALSEKGRQKLHELKELRRKHFADLITVLSVEELQTLVTIFQRLTDTVSSPKK